MCGGKKKTQSVPCIGFQAICHLVVTHHCPLFIWLHWFNDVKVCGYESVGVFDHWFGSRELEMEVSLWELRRFTRIIRNPSRKILWTTVVALRGNVFCQTNHLSDTRGFPPDVAHDFIWRNSSCWTLSVWLHYFPKCISLSPYFDLFVSVHFIERIYCCSHYFGFFSRITTPPPKKWTQYNKQFDKKFRCLFVCFLIDFYFFLQLSIQSISETDHCIFGENKRIMSSIWIKKYVQSNKIRLCSG